MKGTGLRRAVLLGLAMSLTVGTVGYAESIYEGSLIADTGDIIYGGKLQGKLQVEFEQP